MISTSGLIKKYGRTLALQGLDINVPEGAVYGFIGRNGAGKTTTLRILAGLLIPDAGRAEVAGRDVLRDPRGVREVVGYMPDFFGVYDDLRVGEYLLFYAAAYGIRGATAQKLRDDLLELVELGHKRDAFVDTLSRGMQQRLCLARSLIHDPKVLLLDEPASGLDPLARVEMREILRELCRLGKTIIISSHILSELADLCTHVGMISEGRLLRQGPLNEMLAGDRVRKFILRSNGPARAAVEVIEGWPGAAVLNAADEQVEFRMSGDAAEVAGLLKGIIGAGAEVVHFAQTEQSLEDTFIQLAREVQEQ
ncbi:ABC transporter ATP-binding protein [Desulfoscipio geothermicus]|uniref:ABC-2 type transport system ATP-binding protein n=1 Tax=Desulfoscipio geothermicus DSM 3669 TaxID=1121426 RepID=A0A1I6E9I4_9FIRM|nr:ABC transporter ATP-binding protein [Desulfoscipio geothermicus]SFR14394.1 ABC-2 type transport system ATP-binding protein [Desulfoscipio geothermicus DSM 3669]